MPEFYKMLQQPGQTVYYDTYKGLCHTIQACGPYQCEHQAAKPGKNQSYSEE